MKQGLRIKNSARSGMVILMALLCVFAWIFGASAEIERRDVDRPYSSDFWRIFTFEGELPEALAEPLASGGFADYACASGAMMQLLPKREYLDNADSASSALAVMEKDGRRVLVGLTRKNEEPWILSNLGEKALLPDREFTINVSLWASERRGGDGLPTRFTITYPRAEGGSEVYGIGSGPYLWSVSTYESVDEKGQGVVIAATSGCSFDVWKVSADTMIGPSSFPAYLPVSLAHMDSIADYPTTEADARRLAEASWARFKDTDLALAWGDVNLREEPSMQGRILGRTNTGVLVHVLDRADGAMAPWFYVRLGREEGWISGTYMAFPSDRFDFSSRHVKPLPVARAAEGCVLRAGPEDGAETVAELPADTLTHVLAQVDGGWLYVMLPRGEIGWEMDVDGTSGYVREDEVAVGDSAAVVVIQ